MGLNLTNYEIEQKKPDTKEYLHLKLILYYDST